MFTRLVETTTKPGKAREVSKAIAEKILPLLRKQDGFVDEIVLISENEPDRVVALSFWKTKEDAERYHRQDFPQATDLVRVFLESGPHVEHFEVDTSTTHRIAAGKAA